jgi:pyruvate dehydrogenase E1 component alpha subunit
LTAVDTELLEDWEETYRAMFRGRRFDDLALKLQRQGVIDSFGEAKGQEAAQIGAAMDLEDGDMVFPSYRQPSVAFQRGVPIVEMLRFYAGANFCPWDWRKHRFAPYCIPVGSQLAHAAGWAWASRLKGESSATIVFFGDGASSQGEVHEAMNYAGVFDAPVVFICENNGWAISLPTSRQTRADGIYRRAAGYGFEGVRVDGNDVFAVRGAVRAGLERARSGKGPTLVEAVTYRMGGHTTSDDPNRYRTKESTAEWGERDPLVRFRAALSGTSGVEDRMAAIEDEVDAELERATDDFLKERGMA